MQESISVVIPAYNAQNTIYKCISSVLSQCCPVNEIIVVNDGSSDGTCDIVKSFKGVVLFSQNNKGRPVARQVGTDLATSTYIAYLDADDYWLPSYIQRLRDVITTYDVDFLLSDLLRSNVVDDPSQYSIKNSLYFLWAFEEFFNSRNNLNLIDNLFCLNNNQATDLILKGFPIYPSTMLARREVVQSVGGWDPQFARSEDFDLGIRISQKYGLFFLNEVHTVVGLHDINCNEFFYVDLQTRHDIMVLESHLQKNYDQAYLSLLSNSIFKKYCSLGYHYKNHRMYKDASFFYKESLKFSRYNFHAYSRFLFCYCLNIINKITG